MLAARDDGGVAGSPQLRKPPHQRLIFGPSASGGVTPRNGPATSRDRPATSRRREAAPSPWSLRAAAAAGSLRAALTEAPVCRAGRGRTAVAPRRAGARPTAHARRRRRRPRCAARARLVAAETARRPIARPPGRAPAPRGGGAADIRDETAPAHAGTGSMTRRRARAWPAPRGAVGPRGAATATGLLRHKHVNPSGASDRLRALDAVRRRPSKGDTCRPPRTSTSARARRPTTFYVCRCRGRVRGHVGQHRTGSQLTPLVDGPACESWATTTRGDGEKGRSASRRSVRAITTPSKTTQFAVGARERDPNDLVK